jgi:hypothetical protein
MIRNVFDSITPAALILLIAFSAGCSLLGAEEFPEGVQLRVDENGYDPGDAVTLILANGSDQRIGYNLCTSGLERRTDGSWTPVRSQADEVCTLELRTLPPGERANYETEIPSATGDGEPLPAGRYRYVTDIERMEDNTREPVTTRPFTVD